MLELSCAILWVSLRLSARWFILARVFSLVNPPSTLNSMFVAENARTHVQLIE